MYKIEKFQLGRISTNTYLLIDGNEAIIIDPAPEPFELIDCIKKEKFKISAILLTHCHFDHFLGMFDVWNEIDKKIPLYFSPLEEFLIKDGYMNGGQMFNQLASYEGVYNSINEGTLQIDKFKFEVYNTPGHTPGGVCFFTGFDLFSGDTLFAGTIGRHDWGYSDGKALIENIKTKLFTLPDETKVYPGHGYATTIGNEKATNRYFQ
jgi:glyoxylase-like metal-dependent hydrolase (beta-lactamase superfamily II)